MNGTTPPPASSFSLSSGTKLAIEIGTSKSLVPAGITTVRGATPLPGATASSPTAARLGTVLIKGLNPASLGRIQPTLTFTVVTTD
jgi:hypothetical protein